MLHIVDHLLLLLQLSEFVVAVLLHELPLQLVSFVLIVVGEACRRAAIVVDFGTAGTRPRPRPASLLLILLPYLLIPLPHPLQFILMLQGLQELILHPLFVDFLMLFEIPADDRVDPRKIGVGLLLRALGWRDACIAAAFLFILLNTLLATLLAFK